jgi:signal transduction histidine kinase
MTEGSRVKNELRLLLLTPTGRDAAMTEAVMQRACIAAHSCRDLAEVCENLCSGAGALLIGEEAVPGAFDNCLTDFLRSQPSWSDLPILVLARPGADSISVATAMDRLGNVTVIERPVRVAALVSAVRTAMRARERQYQLRDEEEQLRQAHDLLEDRVRERTAELQALNQVLESEVRVREAAEARAHKLLRELVTAQENERSRIARDIHDELGQQMTSLRLHLTEMRRGLTGAGAVDSKLGKLEKEANRIDEHISFLAWKIRPSNLESVGLMEAVRRYLNEWSRNFGVAADFVPLPLRPPPLVPEIEINVYRIVQEALNNVAKYAKATEVAVLLSVNGREVNLVIEDNGVGFDPAAPPVPQKGIRGQGLKGMHERAELLGGTFEIESTPGKGTKIYTRIPSRFAPIAAGHEPS